MAGTDSRFNATQFRDAIHFAINMGFPEDTSKQITWKWDPVRQYVKQDSTGSPWEYRQSDVVSEVDISDKIVLCAVKFNPVGGNTRVGGTPLGVMDVAAAVVTMLDEEYNALKAHGNGTFPARAMMDGSAYEVQYVAPPYGLFEVTVFDVYIASVDEAA